MFKKLPLIAAAGTLAIAVAVPATAPAAAKCTSHKVSYFAQGTYGSSSTPLVPSKSWSGTLKIKLKSANNQFTKANNLSVRKTVKGTYYTYMITNAKVHFGKGIKSPAKVGEHITVSGTVTEFSKGCKSTTPTITIKTIAVSK
jgi:hypothetical protein